MLATAAAAGVDDEVVLFTTFKSPEASAVSSTAVSLVHHLNLRWPLSRIYPVYILRSTLQPIVPFHNTRIFRDLHCSLLYRSTTAFIIAPDIAAVV